MQIMPFKAFRFDSAVVGDAGSCIAPPYDVISIADQEQLYKQSEYNVVRITKGLTSPADTENNNQYTRAADYLANWLEKGVIKQDSTAAIYAYVQDFDNPSLSSTIKQKPEQLQRISFIALAKLEEFGKSVRPHEKVLPSQVADRLNLRKATAAEFGLVFMLYQDKSLLAESIIGKAVSGKNKKDQPFIDFIDRENVRHRLFALTAEEDVEQLAKMMETQSCIIADGHHRYTVGLTYSKQSSNPAAKYQMLAFANMCQKSLVVLATHRLIGNLKDFSIGKMIDNLRGNFNITEWCFSTKKTKNSAKQKMLAQMKAEHDSDSIAYGIYGGNSKFYVVVLKDKEIAVKASSDMSRAWSLLDVSMLHKLILEPILDLNKADNIQYIKGTSSAVDDSINEIDAGRKQVAFFMNPVKLQQLKMVTDAGERMPQKSTYFYPKLYSGLTIQKF
jgi:uncharacterized protein (DUF1015 family)